MGFVLAGFAHNVAVYARRLGMGELNVERIERMAMAVDRHGLQQDSRSSAVFAVVGSHLHVTCPSLTVREIVLVSRLVGGAYWHYTHPEGTTPLDCETLVARSVADVTKLGYAEASDFASLAQTYCVILVEGRERDARQNAACPHSPIVHAILSKLPGFARVQRGDDSEDNYF